MYKVLVVAAMLLATGATGVVSQPDDKSLPAFDRLLPARLTAKDVEDKKGGTYTKLECAGFTYWVFEISLGFGVPHTQIGIYAPDKEGMFHLSLAAESWAAGHIEASVDQKTGILELRERANSKLKGQLVLSCNLRTIGTQHSIEGKQ